MSVVFSGTFSGRFTSTGAAQFIPLPSGVDWMMVTNETVSYAAGGGTGAQFTWVRGDATGRGTIFTKTAVTNALAISQIAANSGFFLVDQSVTQFGANTTFTAISTATPPRVTTASTAGLSTGDAVRLYNVAGAPQFSGYDFTITVINGTTFDLVYAPTLAIAGTTGSFRKFTAPYWYPLEREIMKIELSGSGTVPAGATRITFGLPHGYLIGQEVTFHVPPVFGTVELNNQTLTIINIGQADADGVTNTIDVAIDSSGFTTFTFPTAASNSDFSPAQTIPAGMNTATALAQNVNILSDATMNIAQFGMMLVAGTGSPAGVANDVITWIAGKSFNQ